MDQRKHAAWLTAARYCPPINANFRAVGSEANPGIFFRDGCCVGRARPTQEKKHRPSHHPRPDIIQEKILKVINLLRIRYPQSCRRGTEPLLLIRPCTLMGRSVVFEIRRSACKTGQEGSVVRARNVLCA